MARPTKRQSQRLERLEGISAHHYAIRQSTGLLDLRLQQLQERAPEIGRYVQLASEELGYLRQSVDRAQALLASELGEGQSQR